MATVFEMNGQTWLIVVELVKLKLSTSGELLMHPREHTAAKAAESVGSIEQKERTARPILVRIKRVWARWYLQAPK